MRLAAELRLRPDPLGELTALPIYTSWIWGRGRAWGGKGKGRGKGRGQGKREGTGGSGEERGRDGEQGEGRKEKERKGKKWGAGGEGLRPKMKIVPTPTVLPELFLKDGFFGPPITICAESLYSLYVGFQRTIMLFVHVT